MKLTKSTLKQIIKEEVQNITEDFQAADKAGDAMNTAFDKLDDALKLQDDINQKEAEALKNLIINLADRRALYAVAQFANARGEFFRITSAPDVPDGGPRRKEALQEKRNTRLKHIVEEELSKVLNEQEGYYEKLIIISFAKSDVDYAPHIAIAEPDFDSMNPADANIYKGLSAQSEPNPIKGTAARIARNKLKLMMIARDKKRKPPGQAKPAQPKPGQGQGQGKTKTTVTRDGKGKTTRTVTKNKLGSYRFVGAQTKGNNVIATVEVLSGPNKGKRARGVQKFRGNPNLAREAAVQKAKAAADRGEFIE